MDEETDATDKNRTLTVSEESAGQRLDAYLAASFPEYSRAQLRKAINAKTVEVDGRWAKASTKLKGGELIAVVLPEVAYEGPQPEKIDLDILFEDDILAVINKPPRMVVHPAKGHWSGTLTAALAYHFDSLSGAGGKTRPGIVHRLDRDTSGVIVIAKNDFAHQKIAEQFANRTVEKEYWAITRPSPDRDRDVIDLPIGPHPYHREKMAIRENHSAARQATSFYEVIERFRGYALVRILPKTGRTHQIRVHLAHIGIPVICDRLYAGHIQLKGQEVNADLGDEVLLDRQALHAKRLKFRHPESGEEIEFNAPLPDDINTALQALRTFRA
ncbi:MAG: RluA family pseudouridine synthase [bacterium]|nr:RluA family pseudouridine synthase [bacterium]